MDAEKPACRDVMEGAVHSCVHFVYAIGMRLFQLTAVVSGSTGAKCRDPNMRSLRCSH